MKRIMLSRHGVRYPFDLEISLKIFLVKILLTEIMILR